jgi:RNA polymerase sigma-70 factor (ECF subfamily)
MNLRNRYDGVDQNAVLLIRSKAKQLVGRYGFTASDREDIEQELMLDLFRRLPRFDPKRAKRKTFINRVVEHAVARLVERQKAEMRDYRRNGGSLSVEVDTPEGDRVERADLIEAEAYRPGRSDEEVCLLELDIQAIVADLPGDLHVLAVRLRTQTVAELARELGIPRTVLYDRITKLRRSFGNAAMRKYL